MSNSSASEFVVADRSGTIASFRVRRAVPEDIPAILALQDRSAIGTPPSVFVRTTETEFRDLGECARGLIATVDGHDAGFLMILDREDRILSCFERLPLGCRTRHAHVLLDTVFVDPAYRGLGLQRILMQAAEETLLSQAPVHVLATVSPGNPWSIANFERMDYSREGEAPFYGGLDRLVYGKILNAADLGKAENR